MQATIDQSNVNKIKVLNLEFDFTTHCVDLESTQNQEPTTAKKH